VRVSVVATGIDQEAIEQIEPVNAQPRAEPFTRPRTLSPGRSPRQTLAQPDLPEEVVATAAGFPDPIEARLEADEAAYEDFIPPAPEQPAVRAPRMPQIEDLPQLAQNQLRAMREAQNGLPVPETRRRSLLEKLAAFGITKHDGEVAPAANVSAAPVTPLQRPQALPPAEPHRIPQRPQPVRSSGGYDPHARAVQRAPVSEDDHLDIPAFLRRQQN
jgi:cell division protein FtsZ